MPLKIGKWIKGWRLDLFFKKNFAKISDEAKKLIPIGIGIVNKFKELLDSQFGDVITDLIPGDLDDKLKEKLREWLPKLILKMDIANVTANIEDPNERLKAVLALFKFTDDEEKNDFYHKFGYRIIEFLADGNLSRSEAIILAETYYQFKHKTEG